MWITATPTQACPPSGSAYRGVGGKQTNLIVGMQGEQATACLKHIVIANHWNMVKLESLNSAGVL